MTANLGQTGFVLLAESFPEPRWREALIVGAEKDWTQLVVRAKTAEEIVSGVSSFSISGKIYFLLECPIHQLRAACSSRYVELGVATGDLMSEAKQLLNSDSELQFATASEPDRAAPRQKRRDSRKPNARQSESDSSSEEEAELETFLQKMQKSWQEEATPAEKLPTSKLSKGKRFKLLSQAKEDRKGKEEKPDTQQILLDSLKGGGDPIRALLALELSKSLGKQGRNRRSRRSSSSSASDTSQSEASSASSEISRRPRKSGHAKAIENYRSSKKRMFRRPLHHVRKYVKEVEESLGAVDRPFRLSEAGRKIAWGKQKSLQRVHFMLSEILEMMLQGKNEKACLQVTLCLRAIHQAAIDQDWSIAWMICHVQDPFTKQKWGGEPEELQHIASYLKSMSELERDTERLRQASASSWNQNPPADDTGKGRTKKDKKGKGKGEKPEKEEGANP